MALVRQCERCKEILGTDEEYYLVKMLACNTNTPAGEQAKEFCVDCYEIIHNAMKDENSYEGPNTPGDSEPEEE